MTKILFFSLSLVFVSFTGISQTVKYIVSEETTMTVSGTSTLHDWTSDVNTVTGTVEVDEELFSGGEVKKGDIITAVSIVVPVKSIISPRGATMDKKTYDALKSEAFPEIIFELKENKVAEVTTEGFTIHANGNLTIAGLTKEVEFPVVGKFISGEKMSFSGSYQLNMTDFEMEPPSAMFGQIETGEEVVIKFELIVTK